MSAGNRSLLAVLDSRRVVERSRADTTVFAALDHFGIAYEVLECGCYMALPPGHVTPRAAYVLAHDGAGAGIGAEVAEEMATAVLSGAGLLAFDREIQHWPEPLRKLLPPGIGSDRMESLCFPSAPSFITFGHGEGEEAKLNVSIPTATFPADEGLEPLTATHEGICTAAQGRAGKGRIVAFGPGDSLYAEEVFGHTRGIDGLMWRALVWVAAKPFPMRCIPPILTARMDDCNGAYCAFGYVDALNRYGIKPNLGLFIDEMGPTDWAAASRLHSQGNADFSMHAFRDDFYKARAKYKPYAVLQDKPDLSNGGQDTRFEGLSLDHNTGRDLDAETIRRNFERMDEAFARAGIRHSRIINAHFGEIAWRAVPMFLERGIDLPCNNSVVGQLYGSQPPWRPKPYAARGATGRHGIVIDHCPQHPGLTFVGSSPAHMGTTHMVTDILHGHTPFLGESDRVRVREAIDRGIANVQLEFDSLAFGEIMCHEERIDAISPEDWESVVHGIVQGLSAWDFEPAGREQVSIVCKRLLDSSLVYADATDGGLHCEFCGSTDGPSPLSIWHNDGEGCVRRSVDVPQIAGFASLDVA